MSRASPRFHRTNPSLLPVGTTNGVVQFVIEGRIENQMTLSTFMYSAANPNPTSTQLSTLLTALRGNLAVAYANLISADWTWTRSLLKVVHRNDIATVISLANAGQAGGRPAGHAPTEVAGIFLRQTLFKGQHGRGRVSIPAISLTDVTNSNWQGAAIVAAQNTFITQALLTASDGTNTWQPVIGQRGTTPPRLITNYSGLVTITANLLLGTIRRRKVGRGR